MTRIELNWKYRSTNDSEFAEAKFKCFAVMVQDCDGDMSRWHVKRGKQYVAIGEEHSVNGVYHMDHAMATAVIVLQYLVKAVDLNDFVESFPEEDEGDGDLTTSDLLKPVGNNGIVSADICYTALLLVGDADVTESQVENWTNEQLDRAYDWAMRAHLRASDNDDVFLPSRPDYIPAFVREPFIAPSLKAESQ